MGDIVNNCWICEDMEAILSSTIYDGRTCLKIKACRECKSPLTDEAAETRVLTTSDFLARLFKRNNGSSIIGFPLLLCSRDRVSVVTARICLGVQVITKRDEEEEGEL